MEHRLDCFSKNVHLSLTEQVTGVCSEMFMQRSQALKIMVVWFTYCVCLLVCASALNDRVF